MNKIITLVLALTMMLSVSVSAAEIKGFSDVAETDWSHSYIMLCVEHGAISGTTLPDDNGIGTFEPKQEVTLGQFLAALTKLLCPNAIMPLGEEVHWTLPYYDAAIKEGLISETSFDYANINKTLSREDMAFILVNASRYNGETLEVAENIESAIADYNSISSARRTAVQKAYSNGLITGVDTNGTFAPANTMTREQMATVLCRLMKYTERPDVSSSITESSNPTVPTTPGVGGYKEGGWKGDDYGSGEEVVGNAVVAGQFVDVKGVSRKFYTSGMNRDEAESAINGYVGRVYDERFFDDGISMNYADQGKFAKIVEKNGKLGVNVFGWRKGYDSGAATNSALNMVMEAFYFFSGDKDVAYALWNVVDYMSINGATATTVPIVEGFGFTCSNETSNGIDLTMNGINVRWEWGGGNTFYFK